MTPLNAATAKILDTLTQGLGNPYEGEVSHKKLDNAKGTYMAVSVERLSPNRYSVSHYFEQNGDLVPDPDMEFFRAPEGGWYPVSIQHATGHYARALELDEGERKPVRWYPGVYQDLRSFATMFLRNVREQQGLKVK